MDVNGVTCIKGEVHSLMTLMRLNTRWATPARFSRELLIQDESPLVQSFRRLNEYLEDTYDLRDVDCVVYLDPFLQVVISEHASGPLTSAALSSLNKFALYGFLSSELPRASEGINLTAHCISSCVFEETDWESDEIILVKLLELSSTCLRCDASSMLTVGSAWDIFSTCLSIHSQVRASKLLRSEAETALRHLSLTAFSKAESVVVRSQHAGNIAVDSSTVDEDDGEAVELRPVDEPAAIILNSSISTPAGLTFFLQKIMGVLSEIMDPQSQPPENVKFALTLVNIALEAGGPSLGSLRQLVDILRGDVCRHLLRTSQSEDMAIFSLALRVVFNLFVSIKDHMKVQLEVFLTSVHLRLLNSSSFASNSVYSVGVIAGGAASSGQADSTASSLSLAREELALESLLEFCREPSLMHDLYTNYDCDVQCTNLFDSIVTTLCARAQPSGTQAFLQVGSDSTRHPVGSSADGMVSHVRYVNILNRLSFEGVLLVLHAVAVRCWSTASTGIPKKRSSQNVGKHNTLQKSQIDSKSMHVSACLNNLDDDYDVARSHSPVSTSSEVSSLNSRVPGDVISLSKFDRTISISSAEHIYCNDDGFTSDPDNEDEDETDFLLMARLKTAEVLRQRKIKKQKIRLVAEKFNDKPLGGAWVRFASDLGLLPKIPTSAVEGKGGANLVDAKALARFLKTTAGLDKACVGEFLSKGPKEMYPYHADVLKEYVSTFDFCHKGKAKSGTFVKALRAFLGQFRLPGEAQCIDRLMEAFANRLYEQLGPNNPFVSADAAFILAFSTIMLNTDQHNPGIPDSKRMKKEDFIRNNRGINGDADLPLEYLEALYDEIKTRQIQVDHGIADSTGGNAVDIISDTQHWDKLMSRAAADQTPASFTPTVAARRYKRGPRAGALRGGMVGLGANSFRINDGEGLESAFKEIVSDVCDDSTSVTSLSDILPASIHDSDMFQVMAQPVLDTLHLVWDSTEDPHLLCRIVEGVWDYASICVVLKLPEQFNQLIRILAEKAQSLIDKGREDVLGDILNSKAAKTEIGRSLTTEKKERMKTNVKNIIKADFDSILLSRKKNAQILMYQLVDRHRLQHLQRNRSHVGENYRWESVKSEAVPMPNGSSDDISWEGVQYMRGQLLLRTLFHICNKYVSFIGPAGWSSLVRVLLWCRRRGDLPDNLVEIDDFSDARGGPLEPSIYALQCYNGKKSANAGKDCAPISGNGSIWSSVTSLGGFLWTSGDANIEEGRSSLSSRRVDIIGNRNGDSTLRHCDNASGHNLPHHPLLKETMSASRVDALLFLRIRDLSETMLISIVSCIIDELEGIYLPNDTKNFAGCEVTSEAPLHTVNCRSSLHIKATVHGSNAEIPREMSELDGVMIVEWVSRLMFANMHRTKAIWARLHEFFTIMLEGHIEEATQHCPFLVERCVVAIVRAAIHLLHFSAPLVPSTARPIAEDILCSEPGEDVELVKSVWESLRLLKGIPGDVLCNLSDRLGAGLLTFIRGSPDCSSIRTLEQWYLIFSLLSAVSAGLGGRSFVWEAVSYLIDNNLITTLNFSPCRHLVLRFLYRVFPGEIDEEARLQQGIPQLSERNPWLTGSLVHLLRLALMACAGYDLVGDGQSKGSNVRTFPFEDNDEVSLLSVTSQTPASHMIQKKPAPSTAFGSVIRVACVRFSHPEEVQLLLVETVKTFADFVSIMPLAVSKHASFCLQVLLSSCKRVSLNSIVWASMLKEMVNRLPLNYMKTADVFEAKLHDSEVDTLCLKSCNILFESITLNFRTLRALDEFQNLWLSFLSLLSLNVNGLLELRLTSKLGLLSEFVEMLVALLRFLVPETTAGSSGTFIVRKASTAAEDLGLSGTHSNGSPREDVLLLHLTWNSILGVCPGMPYCLKKNHSYMLDILSREPNRYVYPELVREEKYYARQAPSKSKEAVAPVEILTPHASDPTISAHTTSSVVEEMQLLASTPCQSGKIELTVPSAHATETLVDEKNVTTPLNSVGLFPIGDLVSMSTSAASSPIISSEGGNSRMRKIDARTHIV